MIPVVIPITAGETKGVRTPVAAEAIANTLNQNVLLLKILFLGCTYFLLFL